MGNIEIKNSIKKAGLFQYEVAKALSIAESTFIRKLRHELTEDEQNRIYEAIEQLKEKGSKCVGA